MPERLDPPFRMRIRDVVKGSTIAERSGDVTAVINHITAVWALRNRVGIDEWEIQVINRSLPGKRMMGEDYWRPLQGAERTVVQSKIRQKRGGE